MMEIIVTIIILGAISGLAIPNISFSIEKAKIGEAIRILEAVVNAEIVYRYENAGSYTATTLNLAVTIPTSAHYDAPTVPILDPLTVSIHRTNTSFDYTLNMIIDQNGSGDDDITITCTNGAVAGVCGRLGY